LVRLAVARRIRDPDGIAVPREEALDAERVRRAGRPDDERGRLAVLDETDAAEDERAEDELRDVRLGCEELAELGAPNPDDLPEPRHPAADEVLAAVEEIELAGELPLGERRDDRRPARGRLVDLDRALDEEEEVDAAVAAL